MPKKGRAVLWPSVYNAKPMDVDGRTEHQALPVNAGTKFGANAWIHMCVEVSLRMGLVGFDYFVFGDIF